MKRILFAGLSLFFLTFISCKGTKSVVGGTVDTSLSMKQIVKSHEAAVPNFKTLASRVQLEYDDGEKSQSITVSLRMEKDKVIWIKASILGITLAKAMITPEKVQYYETISNTYFDGDFSLISGWLGTDLDFQKTQALLLGQSIFSLDDKNYKLSVIDNKYRLQPISQPQNFIHFIFLDPANYKVEAGSVSQPDDQRLLSMRYGPYQQVEGSFYPSEIWIDATEGNEKTKISVSYKNIDVNAKVSFPFDIPSGFEQIRLTK